MVSAPVLWRSSAPGVDLAAFFLPNPNHPLAPPAMTAWLAAQGGRLRGAGRVALARRRCSSSGWPGWQAEFRPNRFWLALTLGFGLLALGPFIHVAGVNTYIPTPWTLLRYVPLIGARTHAVAIRHRRAARRLRCILAFALAAITSRDPRRRRLILATVGCALAIELLPVPRTLYSAEIPAIYRTIAADPRPVRVLELPFGIRDGLSSIGDYSAASQFYQTAHGKPLVGGYLSRVSPQRKRRLLRRRPVLNALVALSEKRELSARGAERARRRRGRFPRAMPRRLRRHGHRPGRRPSCATSPSTLLDLPQDRDRGEPSSSTCPAP